MCHIDEVKLSKDTGKECLDLKDNVCGTGKIQRIYAISKVHKTMLYNGLNIYSPKFIEFCGKEFTKIYHRKIIKVL
jgi:hypothetical protein